MAAQISGIFPESIENAIKNSKVLVVGAGGIGCELLKNLVLSGFHDIEVVSVNLTIPSLCECQAGKLINI